MFVSERRLGRVRHEKGSQTELPDCRDPTSSSSLPVCHFRSDQGVKKLCESRFCGAFESAFRRLE